MALPTRLESPIHVRFQIKIFDKIYEREITALYLVGENPLLTEANARPDCTPR